MILVASFEIIPTERIYPLFMTFPVEETFNEKFDRLDYDSYYWVMNMGTLGILMMIILLNYPVYFLMKCIKCNCAKNIRNSWEHGLFWNHSILFLKEAYLELIISCVVQCLVMTESWDFNHFWSNLSNVLAIFGFFLSIGLVFITVFVLWPNYDKLENDFFE